MAGGGEARREERGKRKTGGERERRRGGEAERRRGGEESTHPHAAREKVDDCLPLLRGRAGAKVQRVPTSSSVAGGVVWPRWRCRASSVVRLRALMGISSGCSE